MANTPTPPANKPQPETNRPPEKGEPVVVAASSDSTTDHTAHIKGRVGLEISGDDLDSLSSADLFKAAQKTAPTLTPEIAEGFDLSDEEIKDIAVGAVPAPPVHGPVHSVDQYLTPAGFVSVPIGTDLKNLTPPSAGSR
jgi:hypothetical protein